MTDDSRYTKPDLRRRLKDEIHASDRGGAPGQWSARKSQILVQEYEARGGGYRGGKGEDQRSLERWTDEDWRTSDGSGDARGGGSTSRYLPRDAWALLDESARREAERTKERTDEQYADWPEGVRRAMAELGRADGPGLTKEALYERARELDVEGRSTMDRDELKDAILATYRERGEGLRARTKDELAETAREMDVEGRSSMTKDELVEAIRRRRSPG